MKTGKFYHRRPAPLSVIGDLIVDEIYLRIWDAAAMLCCSPKRHWEKGTPLVIRTREYLCTLKNRAYRFPELLKGARKHLRSAGLKFNDASLATILRNQTGLFLERIRHGTYRPRFPLLTADIPTSISQLPSPNYG